MLAAAAAAARHDAALTATATRAACHKKTMLPSSRTTTKTNRGATSSSSSPSSGPGQRPAQHARASQARRPCFNAGAREDRSVTSSSAGLGLSGGGSSFFRSRAGVHRDGVSAGGARPGGWGGSGAEVGGTFRNGQGGAACSAVGSGSGGGAQDRRRRRASREDTIERQSNTPSASFDDDDDDDGEGDGANVAADSERGSDDAAVCMPLFDLQRLTSTSADALGYSYGAPNRQLPRRIILVRHGESYGNVDESEYTRTPDSQIRLTSRGHEQASETGRRLRAMFDADDVGADASHSVFFYISPYRRSKETALGIAQAFESARITGVREEPQLREQDFGNFQDLKRKKLEKRERRYFGRFFYRFPDGESGADVYDRITIFEDHMVRDIDAGRFSENTNMVLCTHGLTLRLFLMRWFHWTVAEYERIANPPNSTPIILERIEGPLVNRGTFHTKELYRLSDESLGGLPGCTPEMATMILPEKCWERALTLSEEEVKWGRDWDVSYDDDVAPGGAVNKDGCAFNPEEPTKPLKNNNC